MRESNKSYAKTNFTVIFKSKIMRFSLISIKI